MRAFRDLAIRQKLAVMITGISGAGLFLASAGFALYDRVTFRQQMVRQLEVLAASIGVNTTAALTFDVPGSAEEVLSSLRVQPHVQAATIFTPEGRAFAQYRPAGGTVDLTTPPPTRDGHEFTGEYLRVWQAVRQEGERIGTVYIQSSLEAAKSRVRGFVTIVAVVLTGCLALIVLLTGRLQRVISGPILQLAEVTTRVREEKNYGVRAATGNRDELGVLIDGFNEMLEQIQLRDAELTVAKEQAEDANRTKSGFLANMSHELRTPLNAILGYSEMLIEEAEDRGHADYVPDLRRVHASGKHLLALINDVLDLSKIEAGKIELDLEDFAVAPLIQDVAATVQPLVAAKRNSLTTVVGDDLPTLHADVTRVRQILLNLLSNACKFTENGNVALRVGRETARGQQWLVFEVRDTGIGMSTEQLGRLFQAFTQADASTSRKFGGTGLGLVISRRLARMMSGDVTVVSAIGQGSTFTLRLPVGAGPAERGAGGAGTAALGAEPRTVLVVDRDPAWRARLSEILSAEGLRVVTAADGEQALQLARAERPAAITLDVDLKPVDGLAVLTALKADPELRDLPVILVTSDGEAAIGMGLGAASHLTKPVDRDSLIAVLRRYVRADRPTVLVVDDDPPTRQLIRRILDKEGCVVQEAAHGREALQQFAAARPDLILLDLMMPEMDGFEFTRQLRARPEGGGVPIVVVTSKDMTAQDYLQLMGRVEKVVLKGGSFREELLAEVRRLLVPAAS